MFNKIKNAFLTLLLPITLLIDSTLGVVFFYYIGATWSVLLSLMIALLGIVVFGGNSFGAEIAKLRNEIAVKVQTKMTTKSKVQAMTYRAIGFGTSILLFTQGRYIIGSIYLVSMAFSIYLMKTLKAKNV